MSIVEKPVQEVVVPTESIEAEGRHMTRRVLWKLDLHVLPPLALVSGHPLSFTAALLMYI